MQENSLWSLSYIKALHRIFLSPPDEQCIIQINSFIAMQVCILDHIVSSNKEYQMMFKVFNLRPDIFLLFGHVNTHLVNDHSSLS